MNVAARMIYLVVSGDMHVAYAVARDLSRGLRRHECRGTNDLSRGFRRHECRGTNELRKVS
jgi:nitrogenase subunit NifH